MLFSFSNITLMPIMTSRYAFRPYDELSPIQDAIYAAPCFRSHCRRLYRALPLDTLLRAEMLAYFPSTVYSHFFLLQYLQALFRLISLRVYIPLTCRCISSTHSKAFLTSLLRRFYPHTPLAACRRGAVSSPPAFIIERFEAIITAFSFSGRKYNRRPEAI